MRAIARLALVTALLGSLAGAALVYDQGVHVAIPGITRDTVAGRVVDVIDGDTIDVSIDDARTRVHLAGIVAPLPAGAERPADCLAPEARTHLRSLTPVGSRVHLRSVAPNDDGSLTATVHHRLRLIDAAMVSDGMATASDAAVAGAAPADAPAVLPIPDPKAWLDGFEARAHADDLAQVLDGRDSAAARRVGLHGVEADCTLPARVTAAVNDASAAATLPRTTAELASLDVTARTAELPTLAERIAALLAELDGDRAGFPLRAFDDEQLTAMRDQLTVTAQRLGAAPQEMADAHAAAVAAMAPPEPAPAPEPADGLITGGQGDPAAPGDSTDPATAGGALGDGTTAPRGPAPPLHVGQDPNDPINDPAVIAGLTYEDYTGCRAYAGFTPDALDEHRRPYAKVDCRTKQPIG